MMEEHLGSFLVCLIFLLIPLWLVKRWFPWLPRVIRRIVRVLWKLFTKDRTRRRQGGVGVRRSPGPRF